MNFRTEIDPIKGLPQITHDCSVMTIGSCFADEIGNALQSRLYHTLVNPVGTLFNTASINNAVEDICSRRHYTPQMLVADDTGRWHSFNHHSRFSHHEPQMVVDSINLAIDQAHDFLKNDNLIVAVTVGSARAFKLKQTGAIVANCHKFHPDIFEVTDLDIGQITHHLSRCVENISRINPRARFIFTVSPVRHKSYGLHTDKLSKARLLLAVDNIVANYGQCSYFPAYEIMLDDLRDYRFYADDMVHPSDMAVEYIFDKLSAACTSCAEQNLNDILHKMGKRLHHRSNHDTDLRALLLKNCESYISRHPKIGIMIDRLTNGKQ